MSSDALIIWLWQNAKRISWWTGWLLLSLIIVGYFGSALWTQQAQGVFIPGALSAGHHQFADKCQVCHQAFARDSQAACIGCHANNLANDTHSASKVANSPLDVTRCVNCHTEHKPEITKKMGVTRTLNFCVSCHQKTLETRPNHQQLAADSCTQCHNYHDNRILTPSFLNAHHHEPRLSESPRLMPRNFGDYYKQQAKFPLKSLNVIEQDSPAFVHLSTSLASEWEKSRHAQTGVNCKACHSNPSVSWIEKPDYKVCQDCHQPEKESYLRGKHGVTVAYELPATEVIAHARLPMQMGAQHRNLNCNSCHPAHRFETAYAAIDGCLNCHADSHSLEYKQSTHYKLWVEEQSGKSVTGIGVSCASCHLPRVRTPERVVVEHSPSSNLHPNHKMLETVCLTCHGLEFSLDALSDPELIQHNFNAAPKAPWKGWVLLPPTKEVPKEK
jgi:predicted CXXCH cytochrome family protein